MEVVDPTAIRTELVELLLTDERIERLPARPWALNAALGHLAETIPDESAYRPALEAWAHKTAMGYQFPGLTSVVWELAGSGTLVPTRVGQPRYVVDAWLQAHHRTTLAGLPDDVRRAFMDASAYLASLAAMPIIRSKCL
jgi:hypothetical protein